MDDPRNVKQGKMVLVMFDEELVELNEEVAKHPDLMQRLRQQDNRDVYVLLAEIAAYCSVILDDTYTHDDIKALCLMLKEELYKKRTGLVIIH